MRGIELLGSLSSVFGAAFLAVLNANRIQGSTDDVIANPWKVLNTATANEDNGVLLQIVPDARDIRGDFDAIGQPYTSHLSEGRVWLLRRRGINSHTYPAFLRTTLQRRTTRLVPWLISTLSN